MKGRALAALLAVALAAALAVQTRRVHDRLLASRLLRRVEVLTIATAGSGRLSPQLLAANLETLRRAAALDPAEVGIPIARGSQYLLLGRPGAAIEAYEQALALEPRPEIYLNLARAYRLAGDEARARQALALTRRLDPNLARAVP